MPNGKSKKYGPHQYPGRDGTLDCVFGCGCWMGPTRSGGPTGLDPFGKCPGNPLDGEKGNGNADYDRVITQRIRDLESENYQLKKDLEHFKPGKEELVEKIKDLQNTIGDLKRKIFTIKQAVE